MLNQSPSRFEFTAFSRFGSKTTIATLVAIFGLASALSAQDFDTVKLENWHQWRGPNANGVAVLGNPPMNWDQETNIKWKIEVPGEGSSTPIVWKDQVFVLSAIVTDRKAEELKENHPEAKTQLPQAVVEFYVWSYNRNTGDLNWKRKLVEAVPHEGRHPSTTYAASSPMTDGKHLYVSFGSFGIFCLTLEGDVVWEKDLGDMRTRRGWGEAVSPVVHGDKLVVNWDQEEQSQIFVLNKSDGDVVWSKDRNEPTTWATPLIVNAFGNDQLITNGTTAVRSYDLHTGKIIWESPGTTLNAIPCPLQDGDKVICMAGYQGNLAMSIDLNSKGKLNSSKIGLDQAINWKFAQNTPYVPSPLLIDGRLYFTKSLSAILSCVNAETAEPLYDLQRLPSMKRMYASPVAFKDRIYLTSREGTTLVVKNSDEFEVLATNKLEEEIDASPAIAGNQIFMRSKKHLYCIQRLK